MPVWISDSLIIVSGLIALVCYAGIETLIRHYIKGKKQ
jgi:hypothetical protein